MSVICLDNQRITWDFGSAFSLAVSAVGGCWLRLLGDTTGSHQGILTLEATPATEGTWEIVYTNNTYGALHSDTAIGTQNASPYTLSTNELVWVVSQREAGGGSLRLRVFADDVGMTKLGDVICNTDHGTSTPSVRYLSLGDTGTEANHEVRLVKFVNSLNWTDSECRAEAASDLLVKSGGDHRFACRVDTLDQSTAGIHQCCGTDLGTITGSPTTGTMVPTNSAYPAWASDDFNRANESPLAAPWVAVAGGFTGAMNLVSNAVEGNSVDGPRMYDGGVQWPNDQWAEMVTAGTGAFDHGLKLRCATGAGYVWFCGNGDGGIRLATVGTYAAADIATRSLTGVIGAGDVLRFEVQGNVFGCYRNGGLIGTTFTDSGRSTGKVGLFSYDTTGRVTAFAAGGFSAPTGRPRRLTQQWRGV